MESKIIESRVFQTYIKDNICRTTVKLNASIEIADAKENTKIIGELSKGNIYPILVDLRKINTISKEARDYFSMHNRSAGVTAIAMLIKSPVSSIIGNFFLGLNKPTVSTQLFTSEDKAIKWLQQFIRNQ
jgi:hypothetical protein